MIETRLCWNATSNISFNGETDWESWDDETATADEVEKAMSEPQGRGPMNLSLGLEIVLEACGLDWWVETREAADV